MMAELLPGGRGKPPQRRIKLLLSDIDGTLVTREKRLHATTIEAVGRLQDSGILFAVTSSRPPQGMRMLVEPLGITAPLAGFNGGMFVTPDMTPIGEKPVPALAAAEALRAIHSSGADAWIFSGADWLVLNPDGAHVEHEAHTVQYKPHIVSDFSGVDFGRVSKLVAVSDDMDIMAACELALRTALGGMAAASRSQAYYIDVTNSDANKGAVVDWLAQNFTIHPEEIATIGDMQNDVRMFRRAGLAIAMGNAKDDVKAEAHFITASNEDNGVAKAIEAILDGRV